MAFLIRRPNHLKAAFLTLDQMRSGHFPISYKEAVIVVCGKEGMGSLKKENKMFALDLASAKSKGVRVAACGLTLKKMGLSSRKLHPAVEVVENGLYEMIRLKSEGFISVDI